MPVWRLGQYVEGDVSGRPRLTVTLPDRSALDSLAQTRARLLLAAGDGARRGRTVRFLQRRNFFAIGGVVISNSSVVGVIIKCHNCRFVVILAI